jgi:hypothetical protein
MIKLAKALPGELEGDIDPEDYGFEVIKEEPPSEEETAERVGRLYAQAKERTGVVIPQLEEFLRSTGHSPEGVTESEGDLPSNS